MHLQITLKASNFQPAGWQASTKFQLIKELLPAQRRRGISFIPQNQQFTKVLYERNFSNALIGFKLLHFIFPNILKMNLKIIQTVMNITEI